MAAAILSFVSFGYYLLWMVLFAAFVLVLFGLSDTIEENPERPHILEVLETAHKLGELSDEEYQRQKALIEKEIEEEKRAA